MNHLKNLTDRVQCPFDPVHVVERRRLQAHLIKCKRNLPKNHDFVQCQFWNLHYVRRSELKDHLESCEHRLEKEAHKREKEAHKRMWDAEKQPKFFEPLLTVNAVMPSHELESWDDQTMTAPSFSSEMMITKAKYMTVPQGLTKSQRKEFRDKERDRLRKNEEEKRAFLSSGEKKNLVEKETIPPLPRKPTENPMRRIAAKFSAPKGHSESNGSFSSAVTSRNTSEAGCSPSMGRGKGVYGWSHIAETEQEFSFSSNEFPKL